MLFTFVIIYITNHICCQLALTAAYKIMYEITILYCEWVITVPYYEAVSSFVDSNLTLLQSRRQQNFELHLLWNLVNIVIIVCHEKRTKIKLNI